MENQNFKKSVEEVIKEEIRKGKLIKSKDILELLPEVTDTVQIDCKKMRRSIEQCLSAKNPVNSFLNLFGVQLVNMDKGFNNLLNPEHRDVSIKIDNSRVRQWLMINSERFKSVVEKISYELYNLETEANEKFSMEKEDRERLFFENKSLKDECNGLKSYIADKEEQVARRIQKFLSVSGKEAVSQNEELIELLSDLDIEVHWDCSNTSLTDAAMFNEFTTDIKSKLNEMMPCLIRNGSVYLKGVRYKAPPENMN